MLSLSIEGLFQTIDGGNVKAELDIRTLMRGNLKAVGHVLSKLGKIWKNRKGLTSATGKLLGYITNVSLKHHQSKAARLYLLTLPTTSNLLAKPEF
ncbi:MAG: hypothetical protein IPI39_11890 [Candidatus Obscuribacter sp.]|nr:hypothetical protein [Candidatus Obscuribacter sp.]